MQSQQTHTSNGKKASYICKQTRTSQINADTQCNTLRCAIRNICRYVVHLSSTSGKVQKLSPALTRSYPILSLDFILIARQSSSVPYQRRHFKMTDALVSILELAKLQPTVAKSAHVTRLGYRRVGQQLTRRQLRPKTSFESKMQPGDPSFSFSNCFSQGGTCITKSTEGAYINSNSGTPCNPVIRGPHRAVVWRQQNVREGPRASPAGTSAVGFHPASYNY